MNEELRDQCIINLLAPNLINLTFAYNHIIKLLDPVYKPSPVYLQHYPLVH